MIEIEARGDATIEDIAALVSGSQGERLLEEGDMEAGLLSGGQVVGLIQDIPSVREWMDAIIRDARAIVRTRLAGLRSAQAAQVQGSDS